MCLIFIFLTPKSWLSGGELPHLRAHQSPIATTVVLGPEVVSNESDTGQIEERVRALTGRTTVEIVNVRKVVGTDGRPLSFEVDIR